MARGFLKASPLHLYIYVIRCDFNQRQPMHPNPNEKCTNHMFDNFTAPFSRLANLFNQIKLELVSAPAAS